ncbi:MAG: hypothetical protein CMP22_08515 [Rickettsiales bacterium]|nr:hypothetical protein [Rickettsiales bacterium]
MVYLFLKNVIFALLGLAMVLQFFDIVSISVLAGFMGLLPEGMDIIPACFLLIIGVEELFLYFMRDKFPIKIRGIMFLQFFVLELLFLGGIGYVVSLANDMTPQAVVYFGMFIAILSLLSIAFKLALKDKIIKEPSNNNAVIQ